MQPIGLYSISVRGLAVPDLLAWAAACGMPFVHLRGGARGVGLTAQSDDTVRAWARVARETVPITGVTADVELADLLIGGSAVRWQAAQEVTRLARATRTLGGAWVRLLARTPLTCRQLTGAAALPAAEVPLLAEIHHPQWMSTDVLTALLDASGPTGGLRLLADTAQLAAALPADLPATASGAVPAWLDLIAEHALVLHLSDPGTGLTGCGPALVAAAVQARIHHGLPLQVAVEWTGPDRSPRACLARYRAATAWWRTMQGRRR
ncbi:hypothetical protein SAMN05421505_1609 [Sinosporangium album]|uniref:Xylose isomerase-like TIM barrel n=2 Tax=Sinosporangium album TaxID=504805 RepID=A0A1G8L2W3_9ACTN|nr:hypothetical protein SAMN05421505_1609 [Sinosporangium album]